ncbi:uncharacterized protein TNCV_5140751 [Trichonephila clavipes]|nr:uncharacterized protein TNCV_5140751 [Trichonephila clavipes]
MAKKSSVLRQERRQTGSGEVPKEAELTDFEMRFLEEPILTLPLSTPFDSDSTDIEISMLLKFSSFSLFWGLHYELIPGFCIYLNVYIHNAVMDMNDLKPTPKIARPLKETLAMFRKRAKTPTAPSAAARAAACIEEEHRMKIKYMEMDEERKNEEHQLRMEQLSNNMKMDEERKKGAQTAE